MQKQAILTIVVLISFSLFSPLMSLAQTRQSPDRAAEPETSVQSETASKPAVQPNRSVTVPETEVKAAPEVKAKPAAPTKQETAAPETKVKKPPEVIKRTTPPAVKKVNKLDSLKIKRVYAKNDNLHVVLHYLGREKLSPQHLSRGELIVRHGAKTDVVFLRNKMAQLQQLGVPGRSVDIDTGIKPQNEMVKVTIKGQRDTYTAKIVIKHTGPLEVPKKQVAVGTMSSVEASRKTPLPPPGLPQKEAVGVTGSLEVPTEEAAVPLYPRSKFWDVSLHKVVVYKQGWDEPYSYSEYGKKWGPSGTAPSSVTYYPGKPNNYVIPILVSPSKHSSIPLWFKVKACIKFKSVCTKDKITKADIKKWSESFSIKNHLRVSGLPGADIHKNFTKSVPTLSMNYYDIYKQGNQYAIYGGEGDPEICTEAEQTFMYSQLEDIIPDRSTEVLYVDIEVDLDVTDALDETNESNNHTYEPTLTFIPSKPDNPNNSNWQTWQINLLRPDDSSKNNKWFIGSTLTIQWEEGNIDGIMKIDLYRKADGVSQFVGTIANNIKPSSQNSESFTENYNWYDWRAGYVIDGGGDKALEPNDPTDSGDQYWLKFYIKDTGKWRPLLMESNNKFTLHNFTKKFGHEIESSETKSPGFQITPGSQ